MKNIEKYEKELKVLGTYFRVTREGLLKKCAGKCKYCVFNTSGCDIKRIEWLLQECKEPILTDKEKAYLKNVIEPKRDCVTHIYKTVYRKDTKYEFTSVVVITQEPNGIDTTGLLEFVVTEEMPFEGMKLEKEYTLEELGL